MPDWVRENADAPRGTDAKRDSLSNARFEAWGPPKEKREGSAVQITSEANFDATVKGAKGPVVVNFGCANCLPSAQMKVQMDKLAQEFSGKATVLNVDVDKNPWAAERFGVDRYPTITTLVEGKSVSQVTGTASYEALKTGLTEALKKDKEGGQQKDKAVDEKKAEQKSLEKETKIEKKGATVITSEAEFDAKLKDGKTPVLVNFTAPWCAPSAQMKPGFDKLADDLKGKAAVLSVDLERNAWAAERFGITSMPTTIAFVDGKAVSTKTGKSSYEELQTMAQKVLK